MPDNHPDLKRDRPVPDLRRVKGWGETSEVENTERHNAELVVDKAYRSLREYLEYAQKNLDEAQTMVKHWHNEVSIIENFLASDQSGSLNQKVQDPFDEDDF
jgi:hypothetical protein